jgi:hypothetical protein
MAIKSFLSEGGFSVGSVGSAPIEVIDSSGNITAVGLTVSGNLVVNGSTTTINSTTTTLDDPIFTLGGDTVPTSDDNKDRGIEFRWHDGSLAKVGFFGFDDSTGKFVFIPNATNTSEVFSGTKGTIDANLEWADVLSKPSPVVTVTLTGDVTGTANTTLTSLGNGTVTISTTVAADSVALGTDTTGNYVASITNGSYITGGNGGSEGAALTLAVDATSANTASKVVARDASGNFSAGTITAAGGVIASGQTANSWLFEARGTAVTGGFSQYGNNIKSVQYWNASNTISVGSSYSANVANDGDLIVSGKIGVGTLSPGGKLEVNFTAATAATAVILRTSDSGANGAIRWQNSGGTNQAGIGSNFNVSDVGALEFLNGTTTNVIFRSSGSVGIGITAPEAALHVAKTGADEQLILGSAATNRDISMAMYSGTTKAEVLRFQSAFRLMHGASNSITQQSFFTSGGERLTIVSGGNIGIGTASPGAKLHIAGPHADESADRAATTALIVDTRTDGNGDGKTYIKTGWVNSGNYGVSTLAVGYYSASRQVRDVITMLGTGSVGVGVSSPGAKLHVSEASGVGNFAALKLTNTVTSVNANVDIIMEAGGQVGARIRAIAPGASHNDLAMYVTNSGTLQATPAIFIQGSTNRVGINRSDPSNTLDVNGSVRTTDWYYVENSGNGMYNNANAMWWASHGSGSYSLSSNTTFSGIKLFSGGSQNTFRGHFYGDADGQGFLNSAGNWSLRLDSSSRLIAYSGIANMNAGVRVSMPGGAAYSTQLSTVTGAFKIKLPTGRYKSDSMLRMTIKIYQYSTGQSLTFNVGGYNYNHATNTWLNVFAEQESDSNATVYTVRFGDDGTSNCIWIGETNSTWAYPQVFVSEFEAGYSGTTIDWASGWSISAVTAFDTVYASRTSAVKVTSNNIGTYGVSSITGTANQVTASASTGAVTLSLPQNIHTAATPTFSSLTLSGTGTSTFGGPLTISLAQNADTVLRVTNSDSQALARASIQMTGQGNTWGTYVNNTYVRNYTASAADIEWWTSGIKYATLSSTGNLTVSGTGTSSFAGSVNVDGGINFLRGSGDYSNYIKANDYVDGGYTGSTSKYWIELGAKGGTHIVLNTDGSATSAENAYDHFTIWQAVNGTGAIAAGARKFWITNTGRVNFIDSVWHKSSDGIERIHFGSSGTTFYKGGGTGTIHTFRNASDVDILTLSNAKDAILSGNLAVNGTGTSTINNLSIAPTSGHVYLTGPNTAGKFITLQNGNATGGINFRDSAGNEVGSYYQVTDAWTFSKNTTISGNLTVSGNLIINGTTTTVNSTTTTLDDPIITLGGDTAPTVDDNKDRGVEFRWHNGTAAKVGFFGYDDSSGYFTFIPDATNTSEVFSGTKGTIDANLVGNVTGNVSGSAGSVATLTAGTYLTGGSFNGSTNVTFAVDATSANTASKVVARDGSGNFSAGTITATLSGNASTASDSSLLNGISAVNLYNNMGEAHGTRTSFDATTPSYGFGYRFVQGSTNGPGTGGSQYYSWYIGLGSQYPSTGAGSYGAMFALDRSSSTPYLSVRFNEANSFSSWYKIRAGAADTWSTARNFTIGSTARSVNGSADVTWTLADIGAAAASHNHTSLTSVTSIGFATEASDSASISATISGTQTFFDFNLTDDNNNDLWRWRFTPSGSTVYNAMTLSPSANGVSDLVVAGTITGTRLISNVATGTAPLTVASTTLVTNLNADLLDGLNSATGNTASTIVARDASGNFSAGTVTAALSGNATTATTWQTARNFTIGSTARSVNGSSDYSWTVADIGAAVGLPAYQAWSFDSVKTPGLYQYDGAIGATKPPDGSANYRTIEVGSSTRYSQIALPWDSDNMYFRRQTNSTWSTWRTVLTDGNYNSYAPTLTGTGASGTWGISITGNAATATTASNVNNGTLTLAVSGTGLSGSASFTANQSGNSTFTVTSNATSANAVSTIVARDSNGDFNSRNITLTGSLNAVTKSFVIKHPTKEGKKLRYGSLEGPENGVYVRGKLKGSNIIELPDYWTKLVDPESITVQLTPIGSHQKLYVEKIENNKVYIVNENLLAKAINCFFYVLAERCDVEKLEVEIDA